MLFRFIQAILNFFKFIMSTTSNAIVLKLPELWSQDVRLWFVQVEAAFIASRITQDETKYYNVVAKLSCVSDISSSPPDENKFKALKDRIIKEFDVSPVTKLNKVLNSTLETITTLSRYDCSKRN